MLTDPILLPPLWVSLVAVFIPVLTAAASHHQADNNTRAGISLLASGTLAVVSVATSGNPFTFEELYVTFGVAVVTTLATYLTWWGRLDINDRVLPERGLP